MSTVHTSSLNSPLGHGYLARRNKAAFDNTTRTYGMEMSTVQLLHIHADPVPQLYQCRDCYWVDESVRDGMSLVSTSTTMNHWVWGGIPPRSCANGQVLVAR